MLPLRKERKEKENERGESPGTPVPRLPDGAAGAVVVVLLGVISHRPDPPARYPVLPSSVLPPSSLAHALRRGGRRVLAGDGALSRRCAMLLPVRDDAQLGRWVGVPGRAGGWASAQDWGTDERTSKLLKHSPKER